MRSRSPSRSGEFTRVVRHPGRPLERLESRVRELGSALGIARDLAGAAGASYGGRVILRDGLSPAERFSILVHELGPERYVQHQIVRRAYGM